MIFKGHNIFFIVMAIVFVACNPSEGEKKKARLNDDSGSFRSSMYTNAGSENIYQAEVVSPTIGAEEQRTIESATDKIIGNQEGASVSLSNTAGAEVQVSQINNTQVDMALFPKCAIAMIPFKTAPLIGETVNLSVSCNTDDTKKMIYSWYDEKNIKIGEGKNLTLKEAIAGQKQYKAYSSYMHTTSVGYTQVEVVSVSWGGASAQGQATYIFGKSGRKYSYMCSTPNKTPLAEHLKVFALPSCTFNDSSEYLTGWTVNGKKVSNNPKDVEKELQMGLNQLFPITNKEVYKSPLFTSQTSVDVGKHPIHKLEGDYSQLFLDVLYAPEFGHCGTHNYDQANKALKYCIISHTPDKIQLLYINGKPLNNVKVIFNGKYIGQGNSQISLNYLQGTLTLQKESLAKKSTVQVEAQRSDGTIVKSNLIILEK